MGSHKTLLLIIPFCCSVVWSHMWTVDDRSGVTSKYDKAFVEVVTGPALEVLPLWDLGIDLNGARSFVFQVKAKRQAHLFLTSHAGSAEKHLFEVTIGGWGNTQSVIWTTLGPRQVTAERRHSPLSEDEFRTFWVNWHRGVLSVGEGDTVGVRRFLRYQHRTVDTIKYISIGTTKRATATWRFVAPFPTIGLPTDGSRHFRSLTSRGLDIKDRQSITFLLRAASHAYIVLSDVSFSYKNMYWIALGADDNTRSFIRRGRMGPDMDHALHFSLSDMHYLPFWISWEMGVVAVGQGSVIGRRQFMSWMDPSPFEVKSVFVSTDKEVKGHWMIAPTPTSATIAKSLPPPDDVIILKDA